MLVRYTTELFPVRNAECGIKSWTFRQLLFFPHSALRTGVDRPGVEPGSPARQAGVVPLDYQPKGAKPQAALQWTAGELNPDFRRAIPASFRLTSSPFPEVRNQKSEVRETDFDVTRLTSDL